jgi:hypothetical protein
VRDVKVAMSGETHVSKPCLQLSPRRSHKSRSVDLTGCPEIVSTFIRDTQFGGGQRKKERESRRASNLLPLTPESTPG